MRVLLAVLGAAIMLAGCSAGPAMEGLPQGIGGLPTGAPARPVTPYEYPAVHDMPAARPTKPMSEEEQVKAEKDLQAIRDRQLAREGTPKKPDPAAKKQGAPVTKKEPADGKDGQNTGAKTSP
jgi:hypothetical protein